MPKKQDKEPLGRAVCTHLPATAQSVKNKADPARCLAACPEVVWV